MATNPTKMTPGLPRFKSLSLQTPNTHTFIRHFLTSQFFTKTQTVPLSPSTSLSQKTAIITGGASGIGLHASRQLLDLNLTRLILAVRSPERAEPIAAQFRKDFPSATIDVWPLEMGSYTSIQAFVRRVGAEVSEVDIVILNAAVTHMDFEVNGETGHERVVQVNYLSTVLLAILLLPILSAVPVRKGGGGKRPPKRLTIVGSGVAHMSKLPNRDKRPFLKSFDDLRVQKWDASERYSSSKALLHLFFARMSEYYLPEPERVIVNMVDPGFCKGSGLQREAEGVVKVVLSVSKALTGRTLEEGAWCYTDAVVVKGGESHGCFVSDWGVAP